jgi:hypothetical protein
MKKFAKVSNTIALWGSLGMMFFFIWIIPALAITGGDLCDVDDFPNVGMMGVSVNGEPVGSCSGTLIAPTVVLTAGHCVEYILSREQLLPPGAVTVKFFFELVVDPVSPPAGIEVEDYFTHPLYYWGPQSNPYDVGMLILSTPVNNIELAVLPEEGFLDGLRSDGLLGKGSNKAKFTVVGYGGTLDWPPPVIGYDFTRRYAESEYRALLPAWLKLSQNPATGDEGSCFGDSGGPVFWSDGNGNKILVGITSWGDPNCISPSFNYRVDIFETLDFIEDTLNNN